VGPSSNGKLEQLLKNPSGDGKNFKNILKSLDLLDKKEGSLVQEKQNKNYTAKYMRYKRVLSPPKSKEPHEDSLSEVKLFTKELMKRNITSDDFKQQLISNGINPSVEAINKVIREHDSGKCVKFNELYGALLKFKDEKVNINTESLFKTKSKKFYQESSKEPAEGVKNMLSIGTYPGEYKYLVTKKYFRNVNNHLESNKEIFDWDMSTLEKIKSNEFVQKKSTNDPKYKTFFQSKVFDTTPITETALRPSCLRNYDSSDIFNNNKSFQSENVGNPTKKRNPITYGKEEKNDFKIGKTNDAYSTIKSQKSTVANLLSSDI
jgi:hypothetical protein